MIRQLPAKPYLDVSMDYALGVGEEKAEDLIHSFITVYPELETIIMTAARQLKREGEKIGIQIGRKEGMQEGMHQKAIEIAKSMIQRDLATSLIQEVTGLSKQTIEELKRD